MHISENGCHSVEEHLPSIRRALGPIPGLESKYFMSYHAHLVKWENHFLEKKITKPNL